MMAKQPDRPLANLDERTVAGFGREWSSFDHQGLSAAERGKIFQDYFGVFPWETLPPGAQGVDVGCGSGRWAIEVAPRVGQLHLVDASAEALAVARRNLADAPNCQFHHVSVSELPFADGSLDFAYSLGVLHHVPDTAAAIASVAAKLKPGAPFLVYLYYAFDNRPAWFRALWRLSDLLRRGISRLPYRMRWAVSQVIAAVIYLPLARTAALFERLGRDADDWPLSYYRDKPFYVMRTDALDRFGTRLEQRFKRAQIERMLVSAGMVDVRFSECTPHWTAVARRI